MKIRFLLLFVILYQVTFSQSADKGKTFIDLSVGMGGYHGMSNLNDNQNKDVNAGANAFQLNAGYVVKNGFSLGLEFRALRYLTDDDSASIVKEAAANCIAITSDYHFVNKKKFNAYAGFGLGGTRFNYLRSELDTTTLQYNKGRVYAQGALVDIHTGLRWCFTKHVGLFFRANYSFFPLNVTRFTVNGNDKEDMSYRKTTDVILNFRGLELKVGLSVYF